MTRVRMPHVALASVVLAAAGLGLARNAQGDDGNLHAIGQNNVAYHYQRGPFGIDFTNRGGAWSHDEAIWVRDALDALPDVYLTKALLGTGVNQFIRDGATPDAPWNFILPTPGNIVAITVPPAPWHYITFADGTFSSHDWCTGTVVHELGHCCQWQEVGWGIVFGSAFTKISWTGFCEPAIGRKTWNGFVTDYGATNHREDYAECCRYYWLDPDHLQQVSPDKFAYMRDNCFGGLTSPQSVRINFRVRGWVTPQVDSLSDQDDDEHSLVKVYGQRFMGPTDGGFNRVHFGGADCWMHTPISEQTIWAWTPNIDSGSAPVDVQTQDGTSNQAPFTIDSKPWWKFW